MAKLITRYHLSGGQLSVCRFNSRALHQQQRDSMIILPGPFFPSARTELYPLNLSLFLTRLLALSLSLSTSRRDLFSWPERVQIYDSTLFAGPRTQSWLLPWPQIHFILFKIRLCSIYLEIGQLTTARTRAAIYNINLIYSATFARPQRDTHTHTIPQDNNR